MVSRIACFVGLVLVVPAVSFKHTLSLGASFGSLRPFRSFPFDDFVFGCACPPRKTKNNGLRNVIENILVMFAVVNTMP